MKLMITILLHIPLFDYQETNWTPHVRSCFHIFCSFVLVFLNLLYLIFLFFVIPGRYRNDDSHWSFPFRSGIGLYDDIIPLLTCHQRLAT